MLWVMLLLLVGGFFGWQGAVLSADRKRRDVLNAELNVQWKEELAAKTSFFDAVAVEVRQRLPDVTAEPTYELSYGPYLVFRRGARVATINGNPGDTWWVTFEADDSPSKPALESLTIPTPRYAETVGYVAEHIVRFLTPFR